MSPEFYEYFHRQIELWGKDTQESLQKKKILIIGSGGLGSSLAMALGSSGIGFIDLLDFDTVAVHNIHRQILFDLSDEGNYKSQCGAKKIAARSPFVNIEALTDDFDIFAKKTVKKYDLILDATDSLPLRHRIDKWAKENKTPWIYGSVEAFNGQVCFFDKADFGAFSNSEHKPAGIAAPMVMQIAAFQANMALRYLAGLPIERDRLYYFYFDNNGAFITQKFTLPTE